MSIELVMPSNHLILCRPLVLPSRYLNKAGNKNWHDPTWLSSRYERIEIPIHIVPHVTIGKVCLESAVELPKILCQEEQDAYRRIHSLTHLDSVTKIHNGSVFTKNLCSQMSAVSGPLLQWLEDRLEQNQQHVQELQQEKEELLQELSSLE